jgi:hypothetical protein
MPDVIKKHFLDRITFIGILLVFSGCDGLINPLQPNPPNVTWNLQGLWEVSDVRFDRVIIRTYYVTIEQSDDSVEFVRNGETITTGVISVNTLSCSDWDGY